MSDAASSLFASLQELYRLTYFVYLAGENLRTLDREHPLVRHLRDLRDPAIGREFLYEFASYEGTDPPLSVIRLALDRYHRALVGAVKDMRA